MCGWFMDAGSTTRGFGAMWPVGSDFFQWLNKEGSLDVDPEDEDEEKDVVDIVGDL